jgi:hypothetical protein
LVSAQQLVNPAQPSDLEQLHFMNLKLNVPFLMVMCLYKINPVASALLTFPPSSVRLLSEPNRFCDAYGDLWGAAILGLDKATV